MSVFDKSLTYNETINPALTWVSGWIDLQGYSSWHYIAWSNVAYQIEVRFSMDKVNVDYTSGFSASAGQSMRNTYIPQARYVYIHFTNNAGVPPATLRLQVSLNAKGAPLTALKNLSSGVPIYNESQIGLRSLKSSDSSITITNTADEINLVAPGANVSLVSAGGNSLVSDPLGPVLGVKGLTAGTGISLGINANDITITNTAGGSNWTVVGSGGSGYVYPSNVRGMVAGTSTTIQGSYNNIGVLASSGSTQRGQETVIIGCASCYQLTGDIITQCGIFCSSSCYQNVPTSGAQFRRNITMACSESSYTPSTVSVFDSAIIGCYKGYINQGSRCGVINSTVSTIASSGSENSIIASGGTVGSNSSITGASSRCLILGGYSSTIAGCSETVIIGPSVTCTGNKSFTCNLGSNAWTTNTANKWNVKSPGGALFYSNDLGTIGVELGAGSNSWASVCDRNLKNIHKEADGFDYLNRLDKIPIYEYNYKSNRKEAKNIGPMAQDFHSSDTFKCDDYEEEIDEEGELKTVRKCPKDCLKIEQMDCIGILMASVKALNAQNKELNRKLENLTAILEDKGIL